MSKIKRGLVVAACWANIKVTAVWSFFVNLGYWTVRGFDDRNARNEMNKLCDSLDNINDVSIYMSMFSWRKDSWRDWTPWVLTIINKELIDDCDGAAVLGKFCLECIGVKARIVHLVDTKGWRGHAICVSMDNKYLITNNHTIILSTKGDWKEDVLEFFGNKYDLVL